MKSLLVLNIAFILSASFASASTSLTTLITEVKTAVETVGGNSAVLSSISGVASLTAGSKLAVTDTASDVVDQIKATAKLNQEQLNGISKKDIIEALQLSFVASVLNGGKSVEVDQIITGDFKTTLSIENKDALTPDALGKITSFFKKLIDNVSEKKMDVVAAAKDAAPGDLREFADKCGSKQRD